MTTLRLTLSRASNTARQFARPGWQHARFCTNFTASSIPTNMHTMHSDARFTRLAYAHLTNHHKSHSRAGGPASRRHCLQQPQFGPGTTHGSHLPCHTHCPRLHGTTHARSTRRPHTIRSNTTRLATPTLPRRTRSATFTHTRGVHVVFYVRAYVCACVRA